MLNLAFISSTFFSVFNICRALIYFYCAKHIAFDEGDNIVFKDDDLSSGLLVSKLKYAIFQTSFVHPYCYLCFFLSLF